MVASTGGRGSSPRVIYWNNTPVPCMVERFNAVVPRADVSHVYHCYFAARVAPRTVVDDRVVPHSLHWHPNNP